MVERSSNLLPKERGLFTIVALSVYIPLCLLDSTFRMDCLAEIKIGVTDDGQSLVVKKVLEEHNHRLSEIRLQNLTLLLVM